MPWNRTELEGWAIVGMNHYHIEGERRLFVSMTRKGRCITSEGRNEQRVFDNLAQQASDCEKCKWPLCAASEKFGCTLRPETSNSDTPTGESN